MMSLFGVSRSLFLLILSFILPRVLADPATLQFTDCFDESAGNVSQKLSISTVYAQVVDDTLNLVALGATPQEIDGFTNSSRSLGMIRFLPDSMFPTDLELKATLFTTTSLLTLSVWSNSSYLCNAIRPPSPLPTLNNASSNEAFCPIPAGPYALYSAIPWGKNRALTTLETRLRAVDPFSNELVCIDVFTTPIVPEPDSPFGRANLIFWGTISLAVAYWVVVGIARIVSAWGRGITRHERGIWSRAHSAGFILASAISGERLSTSPALLRFCMLENLTSCLFC
jgi:hypothetical protein